jgi:hypothetical protein
MPLARSSARRRETCATVQWTAPKQDYPKIGTRGFPVYPDPKVE